MGLALPHAAISYDRFHVVAMANEAMDAVRRAETRDEPQALAQALGTTERKTIKGISLHTSVSCKSVGTHQGKSR